MSDRRNKVRNIILLPVVGMLFASGVALGQAAASPQVINNTSPRFVLWKAEEPLIIAGSQAVYPKLAATAHVEGCVYIRMTVAEGGYAANVAYVAGPTLLMKSGLDAVTSWKFAPSKQDIITVAPICFFLPGDNPQKLLNSYESAAGKHQDAKNLTALAYELLVAGSPDGAAKYFRQALDLKPDNADAEFGLGYSLTAEGDLDGAIDAYQRGLAAAPKYEYARVELADSLRDKGDLEGAIAQYRIVLKSDSGNGFYRSNLAALLLRKGDEDGAIEQYKQALRDPFGKPFAHYGLGQAYESKGDTADALKEYREAVKEMPQSAQFQNAYNRLSSH